MDEVHLFINKNKLSDEIKSSLKKNAALFIHPYNKIYKEVITEISSSNKLDAFPAEQGRFIRPSFQPISSFGEHATIVTCILLMYNSFMIVTV
ncbi:peptidase M24 [Clostridium sporogenes]|uniref:peptidase M24 n=1 Tax=Clostridium sporogenes TaxID=1509 RepID=UPI000A45F0A8